MDDEAGRLACGFDIRLHHAPTGLAAGPLVGDAWGRWPTLAVPADRQAETMAVTFDEALGRLSALRGCHAEPDGSFVLVGDSQRGRWQVDGNVFDRNGRVVFATLCGICTAVDLNRLLACFGWPNETFLVELVRSAVFLDEPTFRRHAMARGAQSPGFTSSSTS